MVAGSLEYAGAALLATLAAVRGGAGLVTLAVPRSLLPLFAGRVPEATGLPLPEVEPGEVASAEAAATILARPFDALVIGPGLAPGGATLRLVLALLDAVDGEAREAGGAAATPGTDGGGAFPAPAALDAEALNSLAEVPRWWERTRRSCVLTPHPGEFARLRPPSRAEPADLGADDAARGEACRAAAVEWGQVVVLKGARTVIAEPGGAVARGSFENPALATAGTGDVLAGLVGALLAQGVSPWDAARLGVYLHGLAGEALRERFGETGLAASDLPEEIALARRRLAALADRLGSSRRFGFSPARTGR